MVPRLLPWALAALALAGCASPLSFSSGPRFAVEVHNGGTVGLSGTFSAAAGSHVVTQAFTAPAGQTSRFSLVPPGQVFNATAQVAPPRGSPTAEVDEAGIDLAACPGETVFSFDASATDTTVTAGHSSTRCA